MNIPERLRKMSMCLMFDLPSEAQEEIGQALRALANGIEQCEAIIGHGEYSNFCIDCAGNILPTLKGIPRDGGAQ